MTIFSLCILLASLYTLGIIIVGQQKMHRLEDITVSVDNNSPLVSIIVPACNEEKTIKPALLSLLQQDYPCLEIIVLDDRSTDNTLALLHAIKKGFPELRIEQIRHLPAGWIGKNHALHRGARAARGDILLFTDADVIMESSTVSRAVAWLTGQQLDHLTLIFRNITPGGLLNAMVVDALGGLFLLLRPWNARRPGSSSFIGIGAFNMIRGKAYRQIGGHAALKMHPIDDVMLGKRV
jgi:glycosyltransferase involved in cell wall biosynthesis